MRRKSCDENHWQIFIKLRIVDFNSLPIAFNLRRSGMPGIHLESNAKQLGSTVTIGFHVRMISRVRRVDILAAGSAGDDVWHRMRDGRRVESRRPSDETPERLLSVPETGRRLRLQQSPPKFREKSRRGKYAAPTDVTPRCIMALVSCDKDIFNRETIPVSI